MHKGNPRNRIQDAKRDGSTNGACLHGSVGVPTKTRGMVSEEGDGARRSREGCDADQE